MACEQSTTANRQAGSASCWRIRRRWAGACPPRRAITTTAKHGKAAARCAALFRACVAPSALFPLLLPPARLPSRRATGASRARRGGTRGTSSRSSSRTGGSGQPRERRSTGCPPGGGEKQRRRTGNREGRISRGGRRAYCAASCRLASRRRRALLWASIVWWEK